MNYSNRRRRVTSNSIIIEKLTHRVAALESKMRSYRRHQLIESNSNYTSIKGTLTDDDDQEIMSSYQWDEYIVSVLDKQIIPELARRFNGHVELEPSTQGGIGSEDFWIYTDEGMYTGSFDFETEQDTLANFIVESRSEMEFVQKAIEWYTRQIKANMVLEKDDDMEYTESEYTAGEYENEKNDENRQPAELIYSDNDWNVYRINTYEAARKYGKNTTWDIAQDDEGEEWECEYPSTIFYFYINKHDPSKKYSLEQRRARFGSIDIYAADGEALSDSKDLRNSNLPQVPGLPDLGLRYSSNMYNYDGKYSIDQGNLMAIAKGVTHVDIPSEVHTIGAAAFAWSDVTTIDIPHSVKKIYPDAFVDSKVKTITYEGSFKEWQKVCGDMRYQNDSSNRTFVDVFCVTDDHKEHFSMRI